MWQEIEVEEGKSYTLQLCQSPEGARYCIVRETTDNHHSDMVVETEPVPTRYIQKNLFDEIENEIKLTDGRNFCFGPHGEWLVGEEIDAWEDEEPIPWITDKPPKFPLI